MTLSQALKQFMDAEKCPNAEKAFKVIADYMADEEAYWESMNQVERDSMQKDYMEMVAGVHYKSKNYK